jgi:phenylacetaldehyde dehydrogenase
MTEIATAATNLRPDTQEFLDRPGKMLIDGQWADSESDARLVSFDPATGHAIGSIASGSAADVDAAVASARRAYESDEWRGMTSGRRTEILWKLSDLIEQNSEQLAEIETLDQGKPYLSALNGDVAGSVQTLRYMAGWASKLDGDTFSIGRPNQFHAYTRREPVGVVGQIIPWNFPIGMAAWKIAPALAAGCTVVLKPSELTSFSALRIGELALQAGVPAGVLNIVTGTGDAVGSALVGHPGVDKIAFTGSTEVGKSIVRAAAGNLKRISLELGGKNASIVLKNADVPGALRGIVEASLGNAGQVCTAPSRILVQDELVDEFVEKLATAFQTIRVGAGLDRESVVGPLVSEGHRLAVETIINQGRSEGAEVVTGGGRIGEAGFFLEPTVITNVRPQMEITRREIFGPVVTVTPFADIEEAVAQANTSDYGLTAQVWTSDLSSAHQIAASLDVGSVWINGKSMDIALPFGGFKQSGWAQEKGKPGIELYTRTKTVVVAL